MVSVFVSEQILQLLAERIKTQFGIPDPSFSCMFSTADTRGWRAVRCARHLLDGFAVATGGHPGAAPGEVVVR